MSNQSQTYVVTGAAGFIGSNLCRGILTRYRNATIIGIDTINTYYNPRIKIRRIQELSQNKRFIFYKTSILERQKIHSIFAAYKPSTLIHAAAQVGVRNGEIHPVLYYTTNVLGTITILEEASPHISHALVFSSSSVYGSTKRLPFRESEPITTTTPLSVYGSSKFAMEIAVRNYHKRTGLPVTIVRPFSIYGPDGRPDMLPMKLLLAAKTNTPIDVYAPTKLFRDWTYIDDCVRIILALLNTPSHFQIVNVGNGHPIQLNAILNISQKILHRYGYSLTCSVKPANSTEIIKTWADTTQLTKLCRLSAHTTYQEGFLKTVDFFFSHLHLYIQ